MRGLNLPEGIVIALIAGFGAVIGAGIPAVFTYQAAQRSLDAKLIELGVNILMSDPSKTDVAPARGWAISLIEEHSGHRFSEEDRSSLIKKPLINCEGHSPSMDFSNPCNSMYIPLQ